MSYNDKSPVDTAVETLGRLPAWMANDRQTWVNVGMALKSVDAGLIDDWDQWSQQSPKYDPRAIATTWASFDGRQAGGFNLNYLVKMANGNAARPSATLAPPKPKLWPDIETARTEFARLPRVTPDQLDHYNLGEIPSTWRLFNHPTMGPGVVYQGFKADGSEAYKFKTITRDDRGKRRVVYLHGDGGFLAMGEPTADGLVIVAGEEKAAMVAEAGFEVFSPMTGEKALSSEMVALILSGERPARITMANDNDAAGEAANRGSARAFEAAGYPSSRIHVIKWPDGAPGGFDVNDLGSAQAVRMALLSAPAYESDLPRCLSAADFLAVKRPALQYHIDGILPHGGKATFSATSKFGKSMWAIQTGMALAAGRCEWLGWKFGEPARVLYVQAEIMDGLVEDRLRWMMKSMPDQIDKRRAAENFIIREINAGRPSLMGQDARKSFEATLGMVQPQIVILDPLAALCPGMEENESSAMTLILDYISDITQRFRCAVILIHHHSKAGAARGSSVFEAWPESDLQATFLSDDDHTVARVAAKLRCSYAPGPLYWRMPTPEAPWFEPMPEDFDPKAGKGRPKKSNPEVVLTVLKARGTMRFSDLRKSVAVNASVSESTAARLIKDAVDSSMIFKGGDLYSAPQSTPKTEEN